MMPIPAELRSLPHWVGWRHQRRDGRMTKIPYVLGENGRKARANDPSTWRGFDAAEAFGPQYDGIGFELLKGGGFSAIDLDLCRDKQTGKIAPWAREIVRRFDSYTEITPSQEGLRIFCKGTLAEGAGWRNKRLGEARADGHTAGCEVYSDGKYLTVTGQHLDGTPETVNEAQAALDWLQANPPTLQDRPSLTAHTVKQGPLDDEELLKRMFANEKVGAAISRLWVGSVVGYGSHSEADMALVSHLAYWTDGDPARIDRLFRRSSLFRPEKWDRKTSADGRTYGQVSIDKALVGHARRIATAATQAPPKRPHSADDWFTADELQAMDLPEPDHPLPGLIQKGLMILGGKPKSGKSWLGLNVCVAVAAGGTALGAVEVKQGDVLYLALEDTKARLKSRMDVILGGKPWPRRLTFVIRSPRMDEPEALEKVREWLDAHPERRLVVIDTLQKFRPPRGRNGNLYEEDYAHLTPLKEMADEYSIAIVVIHHLRKMQSDDPVDALSGTAGTAGAADGHLILKKLGKLKATLFVQGRDVEEKEYALDWEPAAGSWVLAGDAEDVRLSHEQEEVLRLINEAGKPMTPADVADLLGITRNAAKHRLYRLGRSGVLTSLKDGTYYVATPQAPADVATPATPEAPRTVTPVSPVSGVYGGAENVLHLRCQKCGAPLVGPRQQYGYCAKCSQGALYEDEEKF